MYEDVPVDLTAVPRIKSFEFSARREIQGPDFVHCSNNPLVDYFAQHEYAQWI